MYVVFQHQGAVLNKLLTLNLSIIESINKWSCVNMNVLNPSLSANTNHYSWVPMFETSLFPDLYLSKLMHSNDPQPLPLGRIARYPTLPNLNRPLSAKSNRRRQWAEDQLLPVVQHVKHDRGHVKHVALKQMLLNYSTIGKNTSNMLAFKVLAIASCSARICLTILSKEMATLLWTLGSHSTWHGKMPDRSWKECNVVTRLAVFELAWNICTILYLRHDDHWIMMHQSSFLCPWLSLYESVRLQAASSFLFFELT